MAMRAVHRPLSWVRKSVAGRYGAIAVLTGEFGRCLATLCTPGTQDEPSMCNGESCTARCTSEASLQGILASNRCDLTAGPPLGRACRGPDGLRGQQLHCPALPPAR